MDTKTRAANLEDKYALETGRAFMSGVHALVRLPMIQQKRDALAGKNTAGFISGYRGSPLGNYDQMLQKAKKYLDAQRIVFQPGVNEELAATAVWGTQQLGFALKGSNKYDGVFALWYGKGPGADRSTDVFKHANMAGTTPWGGVIAVVGDDHIAKSSTAAHQSDHIFKACGFPVFFPANVQEILDLGVHAFAMSRYAGVWAGMKTIQEIVESSAVVEVDAKRVQIVMPSDFEIPAGGVHIRWPDAPLEQEERLFNTKWYAALAYIRANRLNYNVIESAHDRLGLIASGKAYNDTRQALHDLGLDDEACRRLGLRLHKVGVVWPLEAQLTRQFAKGLKEILVIEEKRQVIEYQLKEELYNWRADVRPNVLGKFSEEHKGSKHIGGEWSMPNPSAQTLLRANADLSPATIAKAIAARLSALGVDSETQMHIDQRLAMMQKSEAAMAAIELKVERPPWYCSGCPHNTSTKVPEGSRAMAGIGCHYMALWMDRQTEGFTQMGGEGVPWVGQQPFSNETHVFANLGDGTYFHSGLLAIRQSIAAGVNITYKILYNDAVAMTGGQKVGERPEGHSVEQISKSLLAEGVSKLIVVSDAPEKYDPAKLGVEIFHRDEMDAKQLEFRSIKGTSVIIYEQVCATEKRRRRKRGLLRDKPVRVFINPDVCEGCGDCGEQSNCLSIEPLETELGRKRKINQSSCNMDLSCVKGFCPSFVTVTGGRLKKTQNTAVAAKAEWNEKRALSEPALPSLNQCYGLVVAGVGGTGVITIGQVLGMAAHLDGLGVVTQDAAGLAQKGGATWSHVLLAKSQDEVLTTRVGAASADLILACDPVVALSKETLLRIEHDRSHIVLNTHAQPTAGFLQQRDWQNPGKACTEALQNLVEPRHFNAYDVERVAQRLLGDAVYANPILLGMAWQKGWLPISEKSILQAMQLNGVAAEQNQAAFLWGRRIIDMPQEVEQLLRQMSPEQSIAFVKDDRAQSLERILEFRADYLVRYQDTKYAKEYTDFVHRAKKRLEGLDGKVAEQIVITIAKGLFQLMAYKDEYEVARLHTQNQFAESVLAQFEEDVEFGAPKLHYHLAPPFLNQRGTDDRPRKKMFSQSTMRILFPLLSKLKILRGGIFDVFAFAKERKDERARIDAYKKALETKLIQINSTTAAEVLQLAQSALEIKGFGYIKERSAKTIEASWKA